MLPTEPIGSIPRPPALLDAIAEWGSDDPRLEPLYEAAVRDTISEFEATGSPVVTDGEQRKYHNFWTYSVHGLPNTAPDGFRIPFAAGHTRRMLRLTAGPFRYRRYADAYVTIARRYATAPVKQAIISPSALSLMYPSDGIPGYSRDAFIEDLLTEHVTEIRRTARGRRGHGAGRFHRGPPGGEARSQRRPPAPVHRPEQPGADPPDRGRTVADRRAHVPGRRPRLHPQRRRRLRRAAAEPVAAPRRALLRRARRRARSRPRAEDPPPLPAAAPAGVRRRRGADRPARRNRGRGARSRARGRRAHPGRPARDDRRLRLLAVQRRSLDAARDGFRRRSAPGSRARAWHPRCSAWSSDDVPTRRPDEEEQLLRSVALQNAHSILLARERAEAELLEAREALRESQERLTAALAAASTGTFRWVFASGTAEWDEMIGPLFGLPAAAGHAPLRRADPHPPCRRPPGRPGHGCSSAGWTARPSTWSSGSSTRAAPCAGWR